MVWRENRTNKCYKELKKTDNGFQTKDNIIYTTIDDLFTICKSCKFAFCREKVHLLNILKKLPGNEKYNK
jgi:hypothetical protein